MSAESPRSPSATRVESRNQVANATDSTGPVTYGIRKCRNSHWHVTIGPEDDLMTKPDALTYERASEIASRLNAGESLDDIESPRSPSSPVPSTQTRNPKMSKYRRRNKTVEAITFDEFVQYGIDSGAELHRGMPWSFQFRGFPITHENDDCYLIPAPGLTMRLNRGDMLVVEKDRIYPLRSDTFAYFYEPLNASDGPQ